MNIHRFETLKDSFANLRKKYYIKIEQKKIQDEINIKCKLFS